MSGIFGNSDEDRHFENQLLNHLDDNEEVYNDILVEDFEVITEDGIFDITANVSIDENGDVEVELISITQFDEAWDVCSLTLDKLAVDSLVEYFKHGLADAAYDIIFNG